METRTDEFTEALGQAATSFDVSLRDRDIQRLTDYYALVMKWSPRLHLIAACSPKEFATRHVLESLLLLKHLPLNAAIVDVGSGAGLPAIPCLLVRNDLAATLIESSQKKGVFLREALRAVRPPGRIHLSVARFEDTPAPRAEFVTCRALDRFSVILPKLIQWAPRNATLLLFAGNNVRKQIESLFSIVQTEVVPGSAQRFLISARRGI